MERPLGVLIAIGGGEDKVGRKFMLENLLDETRRKDPVVEIISTGTLVPEEGGTDYLAAFEDLGIEVGNINITARTDAQRSDLLKRIDRCDVVFFSGGKQAALTSLIGGTELLNLIRKRYRDDRHFVVAGTGTGAAALSGTIIISGHNQDAMIKGDLQLTGGLGFIDKIFIDTHFIQRGRFSRLIQTVNSNPSLLGIGLAENTGLVVVDGNEMQVIGSGLVAIVDGSRITYTNLFEIREGDPITVEGLFLHVIGQGNGFLIGERKVIRKKY